MSILDATTHRQNLLVPGSLVEVWIQLNKSWANGYRIADVTSDGYLIERTSDGTTLPEPIAVGSVRAA